MQIRSLFLFLSFFLSVLCQSFASTADRSPGFYIGPSVGISQIVGHQNLVYFSQVNGAFGVKCGGNHTFLYGGVTAGYQIPISDKNFIDIDVYYAHLNNQLYFDIDNAFLGASSYLKKKYSYGAGLSFGRQLYEGSMPLSGYVRLGLDFSKIETRQSYDSQDNLNGLTFRQNKIATSFAPGFGLKLDMSDHLFAKFGYTYVLSREMNLSQPYTTNGAAGYYGYKINQNEQRFDVSLAWKF